MERRSFLRLMGGAAGGAFVWGATFLPKEMWYVHNKSMSGMGRRRRHHNLNPKPKDTAARILTKFLDPLPMPQVISPSAMVDGVPFYDVNMVQLRKKLHQQLGPTTLWGYNGMYPGPLFDVRRGSPIAVRWNNSLPPSHFLPVDPTIHGAQPPTPPVRTVVPLHGHKVMPDSDGYPEAWFTKNFEQTGPFFTTQVYHYPNDQQATTLWYHDHALGITRLNIYAGLAGMYLIRDEVEDNLNLPKGEYEIPLIIQDRSFNPNGSLLYPTQVPGDPDSRVPPTWLPQDTLRAGSRFSDSFFTFGSVMTA